MRRRQSDEDVCARPAIVVSVEPDRIVLSVVGDFDLGTATILHRVVGDVLRARPPSPVVIDARGVRRCDSDALELVARLLERGVGIVAGRTGTDDLPVPDVFAGAVS